MNLLNNNLGSYIPFFHNLTPGNSIEFICLTNPNISYTLFRFLDGSYLLSEFFRNKENIVEVSKHKFTTNGQKIDIDWELV